MIILSGETKCGNPGAPANGNSSSHNHLFDVGESIRFYCNQGYILNDFSLESLTCQNDSNWSDVLPYCESMSLVYFKLND